MKIKTSELIGAPLDWAVLTAEGFTFDGKHWSDGQGHYYRHDDSPSTSWAQGGPIIERGVIETRYDSDMSEPIETDGRWYATIGPMYDPEFTEYGPTPLIAAMRCFVASKLGEEVDIPKELL